MRCGIANGSVPGAAATMLSSRPAASGFSIASFWASSTRLRAPRLRHDACSLSWALPLASHRRTHPPSHISLDGLAVTTHCSSPSGPLGDRNGEASTLLTEGEAAAAYPPTLIAPGMIKGVTSLLLSIFLSALYCILFIALCNHKLFFFINSFRLLN